MALKVRNNQDSQAKCRCGLVFVKVAVVISDGPPEYFPYLCRRCDRVGTK